MSALAVSSPASATGAPSAAHKLAQKFAAPTETVLPSTAPAETAKPKVAKPEASKPSAAKTVAAPAERPPLDYEMEMLRRARAEREALSSPKPAAVTPPAASPAPLATKPATPVPAPAAVAVTSPVAPPANVPTPVAPAVSTPAPQPAATIAVQIAVPATPALTAPAVAPAASAVTAPSNAPPAPVAQAPVVPAPVVPPPAVKAADVAPGAAPAAAKPAGPTPAAAPAIAASGPASRASILLALETSGASSKSGTSPSFDPIVCMGEVCFVSAGLNADAVKLSKGDALKLKTTTEASPDACKDKVACVFRNVAIPAGAQLNVIELGSASHDPSRTSDAAPDTTCKVSDSSLMCDNPIATADFRIWVVPEETARSAGVQAIEDVVADGLPHVDVARSTDK
ncbi:MAG: hypothetical protein HOP09_16015 [Hyphomicrobium sp.]|nr:hypothetical protein [Hyphomicrobium sp.]